MDNQRIDPGDPFVPGTVRWNARQRLLRAIEALLDNASYTGEGANPVGRSEWVELISARREWALYGRDGE